MVMMKNSAVKVFIISSVIKNVSIEADSAVVAACAAFILFNDFFVWGPGASCIVGQIFL